MRTTVSIVLLTILALACGEPVSPRKSALPNQALTTETYADENANCPLENPECVTRPLTQQEQDLIQFNLDHFWHWDSNCNTIKWDLQMRLWGGQIRAWDEDIFGGGDFHPSPSDQAYGEIHLYKPIQMQQQGLLGWLTMHEGAHSALGVNDQQSQNASWWANYCWMGD